MASAGRITSVTRDLLNTTSSLFRNLILQTAEGKNPHVTFPFTELRIVRGTLPHPPNTDRQEVRNSITIQFNGAPGGPVVAHLFNDGSIRTSTEMHEENNRRRAEDAQLTAEESKLPALNQTVARQQAESKKMARIQAARMNSSWSTIQKQLEKSNAEQEYALFLEAQAQERAKYAAEAAALK